MPLYTLRGVDVQFPHEAYDCQLAYMEKVIQALQEGTNALLESPTGTGKTLCLLCATLAWRESLRAAAQAAAKPESSNAGEVGLHSTKTWAQSMKEGYAAVKAADPAFLPSIIYSSRTHSQLAQVMRELKGSGYKPKTCVLGSRQQMCLHPTVSALSGAAANQACRAVTTSRSCQWFNRLEGFVQSNPDANREPLDIEDLVRLGQVQGPCPFYLAREMANTAEILFMPYNYLIDTKTRIGLQMVKWENSVLIFDEAHNLEGVCAEASSFDLPAALLAACIQEVNSALEAALVRREGSATNNAQAGEGGEAGPPEKNYFQLANDLRNLKGLLQHLESAIAAIPVGPNGFTAPGPFLFELLAKIGLTGATCHPMIGLLEEAIDLLSDQAAEHGRRSGARNSSHKLNALADALRLAFSTAEPSIRGEPPACTSYRVHIHMKKSKGGVTTPTLSYWCFSPGVSMRLLSGLGIRSVLLTSGTLAPLDSFAQELQLPFTITLENPHVIEASQVWVGVVPLGPKGCALNSSYANRDSREYKEDLGYAICNFARMVPDGLLVFFPSYTVLRGCIECWRSSGLEAGSTIWERITRLKQAVIEPQESALFSQAAEDFKTKLKDPSSSGAVFFAVCRGKVSEGLDFSDRAGRAVVITGIPFAMKTDAKVRLKREVLDEARQLSGKKRRTPGQAIVPTLSGEQWYVQQASRAVNQAMGRVIRHRHDFGAIILADERFRGDSTQKQLSCWLRNHVTTFPNFGAASGSLTKFFRDKVGFHVPERVQAEKAPLPDNAAFASVGGGAGRGGASSSMLQLLSHLTVPAAVDTSGLASMELLADARLPGGLTAGPATGAARKSRLMTALQRGPPASAASALPAAGTASAHSGKPGPDASMAADLWAAVESGGAAPAKASTGAATAGGSKHRAGAAGAAGSSMLGLRPGARPAGLRGAGNSAGPVGGDVAASASNLVGPQHLIWQHQKRMQAAAAEAASKPGGGAGPLPEAGAAAAGSAAQPGAQHGLRAGSASAPAGVKAGAPTSMGGQAAATRQLAALGASQLSHVRSTSAGGTGAAEVATAAPAAAPDQLRVGVGSQSSGSHAVDAKPAEKVTAASAKEWLAQIKAELSSSEYQQFHGMLKKYRAKEVDSMVLMDAVLGLLRAPGRSRLLMGFIPFLQKSDRGWFENAARRILESDSQQSQDPSQVSQQAQQAHPVSVTGQSEQARYKAPQKVLSQGGAPQQQQQHLLLSRMGIQLTQQQLQRPSQQPQQPHRLVPQIPQQAFPAPPRLASTPGCTLRPPTGPAAAAPQLVAPTGPGSVSARARKLQALATGGPTASAGSKAGGAGQPASCVPAAKPGSAAARAIKGQGQGLSQQPSTKARKPSPTAAAYNAPTEQQAPVSDSDPATPSESDAVMEGLKRFRAAPAQAGQQQSRGSRPLADLNVGSCTAAAGPAGRPVQPEPDDSDNSSQRPPAAVSLAVFAGRHRLADGSSSGRGAVTPARDASRPQPRASQQIAAGSCNKSTAGGTAQACPVCHRTPMDSPWKADACGHRACYVCWIKVIAAAQQCPKCQAPTAKKDISKAYFA